jgi:hypothetical protein
MAWSDVELWMAKLLQTTRLQWRRRAPRQFWQHELGILILLEGPQHPRIASAELERAAFCERGVVLIQVTEFNKQDAANALRVIGFAEPWNARRRALGLWLV